MLQKLWDSVFKPDSDGPIAEEAGERRMSELVLSLPVQLRDPIQSRAKGILSTADVFRQLLAGARTSIKIFSPYVDPTFTGLAEAAKAPIQVVTTLRETRMRSSPVLERFSTTRPLAVRYLHEKHAKSQMFQLHAKMILVDSTSAYIGSANFTDTSLHYNFELGLYIEDRDLLTRLHAIFDYIFDFAARPAARL
jgi:phosphatidylserine/phosphatidylglycerophosphate/cardiolipin synthase-like enzyme